ncbi:MAG: RNA polymerase sigma factor [Candidatus Levybacteria bacterium GW2011_GWA2_40_8]|nr:MAG: RNA polymerase sigma factor [Candidatus Levybacteria bacterium GW2011_GWA2_40_8]
MKSLVKKILEGDEKAVEVLYKTYSQDILKYLQNRVPHEEAFEILNDAFLEAIDGMIMLKKDSNLKAWLYRIAYNKTIDYYRKTKVKSILMSQIPFLEIVDSEVHQPEFQLEKARLKEKIEKAFLSLSQRYREILTLHYENRMSIKEIALQFEISAKATESLLYRARQSFIRAYERG